ncbi:hypothetical protein HELRODRAFT_178289 [Helobdella robusta]|uniref:Uncharacterized protein n=1 Tax=Helobdella robusta TaxID=6412 RepID=T1FD15_HELRO|nr:hypothetical protein HELRODRAFT_178289 [Helobdella robusta]ESN97179.1 hypothetical protein HELRODRAFT_178289 [Helobdella robusta]
MAIPAASTLVLVIVGVTIGSAVLATIITVSISITAKNLATTNATTIAANATTATGAVTAATAATAAATTATTATATTGYSINLVVFVDPSYFHKTLNAPVAKSKQKCYIKSMIDVKTKKFSSIKSFQA